MGYVLNICLMALVLGSPLSVWANRQPVKKVHPLPRRLPRVTDRMFNLESIKDLGVYTKRLREGLLDYRNMRRRIRNLVLQNDTMTRSTLGRLDGFVVDRLDIKAPKSKAALKVLIVAGSHAKHGLASTKAALDYAADLKLDGKPLEKFNITIVPGLVPSAIAKKSNKNKHGQDVDTQFTKRGASGEAQLIQELLAREHFDLILDLHVSNETEEAYVVRGGKEEGGLAKKIIGAAIPANHLGQNKKKSGGRTFTGNGRGVANSNNDKSLKNWAYKTTTKYSYKVVVPSAGNTDKSEETESNNLKKIISQAVKRF